MTHVTTHITCQLLREENEGRARGIGVRSRARGVMCRLVPASDHDRHVARNTAPTCERSTTVPPRIPASTIPYPGNFNVQSSNHPPSTYRPPVSDNGCLPLPLSCSFTVHRPHRRTTEEN